MRENHASELLLHVDGLLNHDVVYVLKVASPSTLATHATLNFLTQFYGNPEKTTTQVSSSRINVLPSSHVSLLC
jgi:hypothetical protein